MRKRLVTKKVLVASLGVGAVSYVAAVAACGGATDAPTHGNLMPPVPQDAAADAPGDEVTPTGGNLMGFPIEAGSDAGSTDAADADADVATSGNLVPPIPDGGMDGD
jgi:hypothetical protein